MNHRLEARRDEVEERQYQRAIAGGAVADEEGAVDAQRAQQLLHRPPTDVPEEPGLRLEGVRRQQTARHSAGLLQRIRRQIGLTPVSVGGVVDDYLKEEGERWGSISLLNTNQQNDRGTHQLVVLIKCQLVQSARLKGAQSDDHLVAFGGDVLAVLRWCRLKTADHGDLCRG